MTCGTVSSDDHPINIKGSKGPQRFVKTLDTANAKAAPTTSSSGSAFADGPGPAAKHYHADKCKQHAGGRR